MSKLSNGESFPLIEAPSVNDGFMSIPKDLGAEWVTLLFYRGEW